MAENVPTNGFNAPPGPAFRNEPAPQPAPPPNPFNPAPATPPSVAPPQPEGTSDLTAAIAALTAAFNKAPAAPADNAGQEGVPTEIKPDSAAGTDLNSVDVGGLEDPILRSMAYAMQAGLPAGLDINRVLANAIDRNDASLIDRAYLVEKCGKDAQYKIQIAEGIVAQVQARAAESANSVYAVAGGKEQWGVCAAAFNKGAPSELRTVVANMLNSGNSDFVKAAGKLVTEFAKGSGMIPNVNPLVSGGAGMSTAQALDKHEFQAELRKLDPNARNYQDLRAELFSRRSLGKKLGK